jgi:hypothetical protein
VNDEYNYACAALRAALTLTDAGVCAKVRVQITQKISMTRAIFKAGLVINNPASLTLSNFSVTLSFSLENAPLSDVSSLFFVSGVHYVGASMINGSLTILDTQATFEWDIVPFDSAAPSNDAVSFLVGGFMTYYEDGSLFVNETLLPATIQVLPNPNLHLGEPFFFFFLFFFFFVTI